MRVRPASWQPFFADCVLPLDTRWEIHEAERMRSMASTCWPRCAGRFFLVDAASRHARWYSRGLRERQLSECAAVITSDQMVGTLGHDQPLDDKVR
jgi:hypothetical protein